MRTFGIILLIIGIIIGIYTLSMDTSVQVSGSFERVNNIGLMNEKQNFLIVACLLSIVGVLIIIFKSKKSNNVENHPFKITMEKAKIAEYKGDIKESIGMYLETLYHLENDYKTKKLAKSFEESRKKLISSLKIKIEELKARN